MAEVRHDLPKYKRINKICGTCGVQIYFRRNSSGKYVPFNMSDEKCHYEVCSSPPNTINPPLQKATAFYLQKPKFKYKEIIKNKQLKEFIK